MILFAARSGSMTADIKISVVSGNANMSKLNGVCPDSIIFVRIVDSCADKVKQTHQFIN